MVAAALHQDVHIMRGPGTARPAADGMGSSQDKRNLLLSKRTKNLVKMHRRSGNLVAPLGTILFLEKDAFLNRLIMVEVPAGSFDPLPSRVTHGPVRSSSLLLYSHDCSFPGTGSTSPLSAPADTLHFAGARSPSIPVTLDAVGLNWRGGALPVTSGIGVRFRALAGNI